MRAAFAVGFVLSGTLAFGQGVYPPAASAPPGGTQAASTTPVGGNVGGTIGNTLVNALNNFGTLDGNGNLIVGSANSGPANHIFLYQGSNGTRGSQDQIFADFNDLFIQSNGQGGITFANAVTNGQSVKIGVDGSATGSTRQWFDPANATGTGAFLTTPLGYTVQLGDAAGANRFNVANAAGRSLFGVDSLGNAIVPFFAGVHLGWYAQSSSWQTCAKVSWPHAGCTDATAGIAAAVQAAAANHSFVIVDSPPTGGQVYFATQVQYGFGEGGWHGTGKHHNNDGGSVFIQIPATNSDFFVSATGLATTAYMDYFDFDGIGIYGDQTYASTTGSCFVANARVGERFNLSHSTFNGCPEDGIKLAHGGDPITWYDLEASGNGYGCAANNVGTATSSCGFGILFNKGGSDPFNATTVQGLSTDNNATAGVGVFSPSGYSTADTFEIGGWKSETRNDNAHITTGQPYLLIDTGGGPAPVFLHNINAVQVPAASTISSIARTACSGTSCTVTATLNTTTSTVVYPLVGANIQVANVATATDLNGIFAVTGVTANTITWTQTTTGANESDTTGTASWNRTAASAFAFPGSTPVNMHLTAVDIEGGANAIGPFGYQTLIQDGAAGYNFPLSSLPGTSAGVGSQLNDAQYVTKDHRLAVDGQTLVGDLGQASLRIGVAGDANPRLAANGNATFFLGAGGASAPDTLFGRGPTASSLSIRTNSAASGVLAGTVGAHGSGDFYAHNYGSSTYPGGTSYFQGNTSTGNFTFNAAAQVLHGNGSVTAPSVAFTSDTTSGINLNAAGDVLLDVGGSGAARFIANAGGNAFEALSPTWGLGWASVLTSGIPSTVDTSLWRIGPAEVGVGTNTTGTFSGTLDVNRVRSNTAANTDLDGELALSAATTATYTFTKTYTSHPEILLQPQFNANGNAPWVTYTGTTSFTINFATAVTGTVSYGVLGRN